MDNARSEVPLLIQGVDGVLSDRTSFVYVFYGNIMAYCLRYYLRTGLGSYDVSKSRSVSLEKFSPESPTDQVVLLSTSSLVRSISLSVVNTHILLIDDTTLDVGQEVRQTDREYVYPFSFTRHTEDVYMSSIYKTVLLSLMTWCQ